MAYNVSSAFREQLYSGESDFRAILTIGGTIIDNDQIASISISSPIIDDSKQVFYVGTFISQKIIIKFKTMEGINVNSGDRVELSIGQYVNNQWEDVPIGKFLIDDLAEDYYEKCEINCLDYAVLFKPNIDYSECFVDGKATIKMILEQVCTAVGVELGDYPTTNDEVEVGTYDSTVSGKQWISYIAELKGCNAKMDRYGRLTLQPLKQSSNVPINALESASWETKENFNVTQVTFFDAIRNYTFGSDDGDTLFIRQDNPFITEEKVVQNIYDTICVDKYSASGKSFDLEDVDAHPMQVKTIYGETSQDTYTGKNIFNINAKYNENTTQTLAGVTVKFNNDGSITLNGTMTGNDIYIVGTTNQFKMYVDNTKTYYNLIKVLDGSYTVSGSNTCRIAYDCRYNSGSSVYYRNYTLPTSTTSTQLNVTGTEYITNYRIYTTVNNTTVTFNNYRIQIGIYQGDGTTEWEKYVGGIPSPNPDYPQEIRNVSGDNDVVVRGKNLFDKTTIIEGKYIDASGNFANDSNNFIGDIIPINSTNNYYVSASTTQPKRIAYYDSLQTFVSRELIIATRGKLTIPNNTKYLRLSCYNQDLDTLQLEQGNEATTYEEYQSQSYELELGKNLCNVLDQTKTIATNMNVSVSNQIITFNGSWSGGGNWVEIDAKFSLVSGTYKLSKDTTISNFTISGMYDSISQTWVSFASADNYILTLNNPANITKVRGWTNGLGTLTNATYKIQIEKGKQATTYVPYHEPIELNKIGTYQDYIAKSTGKNLYNESSAPMENGNFNYNTGINMDNNDRIRVRDYIPCKPNTTYTISINEPIGEIGVVYKEADGETVINGFGYGVLTNYCTFTTPNNAYYLRFRFGNGTYPKREVNNYQVQLEEGSTATEYEPYGKDEWYLKKAIGKYTFTGASNENWNRWANQDTTKYSFATNILLNKIVKPLNDDTICNIYSNYYSAKTINDLNKRNITGIGIQQSTWIRIFNEQLQTASLEDWKTWLSTHNTIVYYILNTPEYQKITYQPLIDQLNALQNVGLFEGINHITIDTLNEVPTIDIDYYKNSHFNLWSLKTHNFGDFTLDAWDNIDYDLDGEHYLTLNNNTITYEMSIMSDVDTKIPNKQQTATTNIIGGDDKTNIKIIKTNVDNLNASVNILSKQQTDTQTNITQLQLDVNGINQTVEHIENTEIGGLQSEISNVQQTMNTITNMFQISGGINSIRNSAFLLKDEVWEFTDNGTNPYHTDLGNSYNSTLSGTTVSVAEIKLRSTKVKSTSDNITDLKTDGTKYTFNFYHKQDNYMTTTIKMYSTENNTIKAFNDIVITGQQQFKNYEVSFIPTYTNYTIEIIVTSTASVGYAYISDMILNAGDKQSWQPASDEIYSTTLQMSRLGLQVYSVGDGTITLLGSDGMSTYETSDGKTFGRLVSIRTINGDRVKNVTTQSIKLVLDATKTEEELATENKWVETVINIGGSRYKVEYEESGE